MPVASDYEDNSYYKSIASRIAKLTDQASEIDCHIKDLLWELEIRWPTGNFDRWKVSAGRPIVVMVKERKVTDE